MLDRLTFDEMRHEYRWDGAVVPGVTQILARLSADEYRGVDVDVMERAAQLGRAAHKMIELDIAGTLDVDSLSDELQVYYTAWQSFRATSGFVPMTSEQRVYSERYGYAGTLDMFGMLGQLHVLIDAKRTAAIPRTAGPQTAAYEIGLREHIRDFGLTGGEPIDRYALHLKADGGWRLVPFKDHNDARVFLSCLTLTHWSKAA